AEEVPVKILLFTLVCTAGAAVAASAGQSSSQSQSTAAQSQSSGQQHSVTLSGCVYQTSDQPDVFALERTPQASAGTVTGTSGVGSASTSTSNSSSSSSGASSADAGGRRSGWYRLSSTGTQQLSQYVGKAVRVDGTVRTPQEQNGGEVVVHEIRPNQVTITTIDLKPAPELRIQSITPTQGDCSRQSSTR
ncbi:MAG TPA: hypothetical protein VLV86_12790, partial [Vicinamibacterales bacterium]|nr:hypothetical protein [Vicinamibacterales bacterium]